MSSTRLAGLTLILVSLGFIAVFGYLASSFGYPEVLDGSADQVLPAFIAGGTRMRAVWVVYAALPFGLPLAAWLARSVLASAGADFARWSSVTAWITAVAMATGLSRWPTLNHALGVCFASAGAAERAEIARWFDAGNLWLGNVIGEFIGEVALSSWFVVLGLAMVRGAGWTRFVGYFALGTAASMVVGAFRNVTGAVSGVADVNNSLLPVFLIVLGASWIRREPGAVG